MCSRQNLLGKNAARTAAVSEDFGEDAQELACAHKEV
jgi:hypothetical protein